MIRLNCTYLKGFFDRFGEELFLPNGESLRAIYIPKNKALSRGELGGYSSDEGEIYYMLPRDRACLEEESVLRERDGRELYLKKSEALVMTKTEKLVRGITREI